MNTTPLFNKFARLCRAKAEELPDGGGPPPASPSPADPPPAPIPPAEGTDAPPPPADQPDFSLDQEPLPDDPPADPTKAAGQQTPTDQENPDAKSPEEQEQEQKEYKLDLPEDLEVTDDFKALLHEQAKESGLDGKAAGKYVSGVIKAMQQAEQDNINKTTAELREEWGKNFNANMQQVKNFTAKLRVKSGLTPEDMAPLQSPKGYRLLFALMKSTGEAPLITGTPTPQLDGKQEAQRMLTDPTHRYYQAIQDTSHPDFTAANTEYNRLIGYPS